MTTTDTTMETTPQPQSEPKAARGKRATVNQARAANLPIHQLGLGRFAPELARPGSTKNEIVRVPLHLVDDSPDQARRTYDEDYIRGLAENIRENSQLEPIQLTPNGERYTIHQGHCRKRALELLKDTHAIAIVRDDWTPDAAAAAAASGNLWRRNLTPIEEARALDAIQRASPGITAETLARRTALPLNRVRKLLSLLALPTELADHIGKQHPLADQALTDAHHILKATREGPFPEGERVAIDAILSSSLTYGIPVHDVVKALKQTLSLADVTHWDLKDLSEDPVWKKAMKGVPSLAIEGFVLVPEAAVTAAKKTVADYYANRRAAAAGEGSTAAESATALREKDAREQRAHEIEVRRESERAYRRALHKALTRVKDCDRQVTTLIARFVATHARVGDEACDFIADALGVDIDTLPGRSDKGGTKRFLEWFSKATPWQRWRLLAGLMLYDLHETRREFGGTTPPDEELFGEWTRSTHADVTKKTRKILSDARKARKNGKAPETRPEDDARIVACRACSVRVGKWCVGPTGHVTREFHLVRLKDARAAHAQAEAPKPTRKRARAAERTTDAAADGGETE